MTLATEILADGPVGYWPLNGDLLDASGNGNDSSLFVGSGSFVADAEFGQVLQGGAGGGGTWEAPMPSGLTVFTIEQVARTTGYDVITRLMAGSAGASISNGIFDSVAGIYDGMAWDSVSGSVALDQWHQSALTWDGTTLRFIRDGVLAGSVASAAVWDAVSTAILQWEVGPDALLGHVAIYDSALTVGRLAAHYSEYAAAPVWNGNDVVPPLEVGVVTQSSSAMQYELGDVTIEEPGVTAVHAAGTLGFPAAPKIGIATRPMSTPAWKAANPGTPIWQSTYGEPQNIRRPLNGVKEATILVPDEHGQPQLVTDECEITRNGHRHFIGPVLDMDDDLAAGAVTYRARSDWWYFTKRYAGSPNRENLLLNGHFENWASEPWLDDWTAINVVASSETEIVRSGVASVRLDSWQNEHHSRFACSFAKEVGGYGFPFHVAAWCWIDGSFEPGFKNFGLRCTWDDGNVKIDQTTMIDKSHQVNGWVRHYLQMNTNANTTGIFTVELSGVKGSIVWDHVQVVGNSYDGAKSALGGDQAQLAGEWVRVAQEGEGKADLGIGRNTPVTGIVVPELMRHYNHEQVASKIEGMTQLEDSFDFDIVTAGETKTFTTFFPMRSRGAPALTYPGNIVTYRRTVLGSQAESSVIVLASGSDPAREEGGAWDDEALGGKLLQGVHQAPEGASIASLNPRANEYLRRALTPPQAVDVVVKGDDGDAYEEGDLVSVSVERGQVAWEGTYRITHWAVDCTTDEFTLTLEFWEDGLI